MKKLLAICVLTAMMMSFGVTAFAAPNGFMSSPSGIPAPKLISFKPDDNDCTSDLELTAYGARNTLPEQDRELMNKAYETIVSTEDLTTLNADFANLIKSKNIQPDKLAVSNLFNARCVGCTTHNQHEGFQIVLSDETLKSFAGLLKMNNNGEWELVSNAKITNNGLYVDYHVDYPSTFAILVDTAASHTPGTGDNSMMWLYIIIMAVSASAVVALLMVGRRKKSHN